MAYALPCCKIRTCQFGKYQRKSHGPPQTGDAPARDDKTAAECKTGRKHE